MAGKFGGAAFILIYLVFLLILGLPILVCEFAVGRASRKSTARAFHELEPEGKNFHNFSYVSMISNYVLMMFYTMVAGWMLYYCYAVAAGKLEGKDPAQVTEHFGSLQNSPGTMTLWMVIVVLLAFGICSLGVQKGLEKITKVMMMCLLCLIVVLAIHSLTMEGAEEGVRFYLVPDFKAIKDVGIGNVIFGAMSQAFFTLSVGAGSMTIFGSYLDKKRSLGGESVHITLLDTFVALMAGLIIIPACFSFGIEPGAGPGLIFITLPNVFNQMAGGRIWGSLFFLFMSFAALSTVIAVFENILSYAMDIMGWSRKKAVLVNIVAIIVLSMPAILGFNVLSGIHPLGGGSNIMDLEDFIVSNNILPLGSAVYILFCVSKYGWGFDNFLKEVNTGEGLKFPRWIRGYMLYVIPTVIVVIYLKGYYDMFSGMGPVALGAGMTASVLVLALMSSFVFDKQKKL